MRNLKPFLAVMSALMLFVSINSVWGTEKKPATPPKPIVLKVAIFTPLGVVYTPANAWILKEVEKLGKGRLKFEYYYSDTLVPAREVLTGLRDGVADVAFVPQAYMPGKLPLGNVTSLPMTGSRFYSSAMALAELMQMSEMKAELDKHNIMYLSFVQNSSYVLWTNRPVRSLQDFKGLKVRAISGQDILMRELGAVPVSIVSTEVYTALERKTLDGSLANPIFAFDYKYSEVCKYCYALLFGNASFFMGVNKDSWNKIPPDLQKAFADLREPGARVGHELYETSGERNLQEAQAKGTIKIAEPQAEDIAFVKKVAQEKVWKEWVENMNRKGLPGQKVLDNWVKLLEKWEGKSPFKKPIYGR